MVLLRRRSPWSPAAGAARIRFAVGPPGPRPAAALDRLATRSSTRSREPAPVARHRRRGQRTITRGWQRQTGSAAPAMTDTWVGVVASLGGVTVGAVTTYVTQERLWRRTMRRELYGEYVGKSNLCHDALLAVGSTTEKKVSHAKTVPRDGPSPWEEELRIRWSAANTLMTETSALSGQVSMVAKEATRTAAEGLERHLRHVQTRLDAHNKGKTAPGDEKDYRTGYDSVREKFLSSASREIGIARRRRLGAWRAGGRSKSAPPRTRRDP
jgi:hypothetical protein